MKRALYSLLLIFLMSCGTSPTVSHLVSVYLSAGTVTDGKLISIKDSALVIAVADDTSYSRMKIPFSQVEFVLLRKDGKWNAIMGGCGTGCLGGAVLGYGLSHTDKPDTGLLKLQGAGEILSMGLVGTIGAIAGGIIGCEIQHGSNRFYLYKAKDLEYLKTVAMEK